VHISNYRRRVEAVFLCFFLVLILSIARLFFIQLFRSNYLKNIARKQHNLFVELEPRRGTIYDINLRPQAVNISADSLYACPNDIDNNSKETIIRQLSPILKVNDSYLRERLFRKKAFVWLSRKVESDQSQAIRKLKIKGVDFLKESKRCYPNSYLASNIIGFAGLDNVGLEGAELYYDKYLKGESGWEMFVRDARQKKLNLREKMLLPRDGYDLVLTIDEVIQYIAERELDKAFKIYHAKGAIIIVMNPYTGEILAMADRPSYDLNEYAKAEKDTKRNRAISDLFEPGSVFKIVTASAAIEEKMVSEEDKFFCENGVYKVGSHTLHDHRPHGWLTFREVIEQSSNIGTTKVAQGLGDSVLYRYIKLFGFGTKTGINLPGEISGMIKEPRQWSKISITAIPMGQEVGVTALQLAAAISVIANGGQLVKPYIVKEIRDKYGENIKKFSPTVVRRVISFDTASRVKKILAGVVENGTGKLARVPGFSSAGKTGTAQKLEPSGIYSHDKFMASFIGFAPAENPVISIVVILDDPRPYYFGGVVAAPVFKNVAHDTLLYLKTRYLPDEVVALNESR
jgi:cell division protein FtsI/penicillin-binding protein 2